MGMGTHGLHGYQNLHGLRLRVGFSVHFTGYLRKEKKEKEIEKERKGED
jgi:hypothetical protein